jgi:hypothetical protein
MQAMLIAPPEILMNGYLASPRRLGVFYEGMGIF